MRLPAPAGPSPRDAALLDAPDDAAALAAGIEREILWRLVTGPQGATVRQIGLADSRLAHLGRAIRWIRAHYDQTVRIEELAALATMSVTLFHRHFRAVTSMTPVQFQKQIRLHEARARLLAEPGDVAGAGYAVGYDSPSQFSREYRRMFGQPPSRDALELREAAALPYSAECQGEPMSSYLVVPIGWVESPLKDRAQAPRQGDEGAPDAWLVIEPGVAEGVRDLAAGSEIIVLTWLDRADREVLVTRPRDDPAHPPLGVFSTRSPDRPNPIGLHRVRVLAAEGARILVRPLEALDGTPVIDIKPVLDQTAER